MPNLDVEEFQYGDDGIVLNGDFSAGAPALTNLVPNPSFEINTTGWTGAGTTLTRITTDDLVGNASLQVSFDSGTTFGAFTAIGVNGYRVSGGTTYKFQASFKTPVNMRPLNIFAFWYDSAGTQISATSVGATTPTTTTDWFTVTGTMVAPSNAVTGAIYPRWTGATIGDVNLMDAVMVTPDLSANYFDGDTVDPNGIYTYAWTGTQHQSASQRVAIPTVTSIFDLESIQGLDSPEYRQQTHDREGVDGGYVDAPYETIRTISLEGTIYGDVYHLESYLDNLKYNFRPTRVDKPLYFQTDAGQRMVWCKSLGLKYPKEAGRRIGTVAAQVQFLCQDPRIYTPGVLSTSTQLVSVVTSGRSYPKVYPLLYGAAATNSAATLVMSGNRETPGKLRIDGPVVNPSIINDDTGTTMAFNMTVPTGSYIEIDLGAKSVLQDGSTNRRPMMQLTGNWYFLQPGANHFRFYGTQTPPTPLAKLTVSGYSAWR